MGTLSLFARSLRMVPAALVLCLLLVPAPVPAAPANGGGAVSLDFKDIELKDLIQTISELTGRNFLYDETVRGKVTIISPKKMSLDEAYNLFLTVLNVKGFTVVPSGQVNKIVPIKDAKESNLPVAAARARSAEQYITRLVPLANIDAAEMASTVLAPLIPKTSSIVAYPPSNTLIITDSAANIERLVKIIRELDVPVSQERLEVIPLQHGNAEEVASLATQIITQKATTQPTRRRTARNVQTAGETAVTKVLAYPRTNALVVLAPEEEMATIRELVAKLDQKPSKARAFINVYYLENADAETLAKTLNEILTGIKAETRAARGNQPAQTAALTEEPVTITADKPTNSLIINAVPEDYDVLREIIAQLDIKRKQVYVEALIMELSLDVTKQLGVALQGAIDIGSESVTFGTSNLGTGNASLSDLTSSDGEDGGLPTLLTRAISGLLLGGMFNPITVTSPTGEELTVPALSVLIDLSKSDRDINILSAPRLLTLDNEEAEIVVGSNVPVITSRLTDTGGSTGLAQSVSVERQDVALVLRFTPQVTEGNLVNLNVYQELTDIAQQSVGDVNQVGPTFTKRVVRNTVLAENGRTVALGGLISTNQQKVSNKIPFLGDIPVLGWLFKSEGSVERKTNLMVFLTPRIIGGPEDLAQVARRSKLIMNQLSPKATAPSAELQSLDPELRSLTDPTREAR